MSDDRSVIIIIFLEPPVGAILRADFLRTTEAVADGACLCTTYDGGRRGLPMYDGRWTMTRRHPIAYCFGVASRLLTPPGQKLCFWLIDLTAVGRFRPFGQKLRFCPICLTAVGSFVRFAKLARIARSSGAGANTYSSSPARSLAPLS